MAVGFCVAGRYSGPTHCEGGVSKPPVMIVVMVVGGFWDKSLNLLAAIASVEHWAYNWIGSNSMVSCMQEC